MKKLITMAVFCLLGFFIAGWVSGAASGREKNIVEIIYHQGASSEEYKHIFKLFEDELTQTLKENPGRILGKHRVLVVELINENKPEDVRIFFVLDIADPLIIHWQRIDRLTNDNMMRFFAKKAAEKTFIILCAESVKREKSRIIKPADGRRINL